MATNVIDYDRFLARPGTGPLRTAAREQYKYNFGTIMPGVSILPLADLAEAAKAAILEQGDRLPFYPPELGPAEPREFIARWMREDRNVQVTANEVLITNGSNEAIRLVIDNLIRPGDVVIVEQNLYLVSLQNFRRWKAEIVAIETDDDGMRTDVLAETLAALAAQGKHPKLIYTIPTYQNPEGFVLPLARRQEMLRLAQQYEVLILEDDCYVHEQLDGDPVPPAMLSMPGGRDWVIYCATFSKIVAPAVRFGWLLAPAPILTRITNNKLSGGHNDFATLITIRFLEEHMNTRIERLNRDLKARRDAMVAALRENFGELVNFRVPHGGMCLWVAFPEGTDMPALLEKATAAGVSYNHGAQFSVKGGSRNFVRLSYAFCDETTIREGIGVLAKVLYQEGALPLGQAPQAGL